MERIAIIGTGIAGMGAAYFLKDKYDVTFYEKNSYSGGHTHTLSIDEDGETVHIDSAFMVYNEITYPLLTRLFKELSVETKPTSMSFSVQHIPSGLEYKGTDIDSFFVQRRNLLNFPYLKMLREMTRFCKEACEVIEGDRYAQWTVARYVKEKKYGNDFLHKFLIPMGSAVWSTPVEKMLEFPIATLVRFFKNHGFLGLNTHYQWRTVCGGSRMYRDKVMSFFKGKVKLNSPAVKVKREGKGAVVLDMSGGKESFDRVVMAAHADETLKMLADPSFDEIRLLSPFKYQMNRATLHTDRQIMPKNKKAWASWNYRTDVSSSGRETPSTIYDMNSLQQVSKRKHYFISINDPGKVDPKKVLWENDYAHPLFDVAAIKAQDELPCLNEKGPVYFCGSYFKYGFHEDALRSGYDAASRIRNEKVWG